MKQQRGLYLRYNRNDWTGNPGVNLALATILVLSAFLMATGAMVLERLTGAQDSLFEPARPPHFLQMHKGDYDRAALQAFAESRSGLEAWQVSEMLGFNGAAIAWRRAETGETGTFADRLIDNLFVTQNRDFDYLIDQSGAVPAPDPGQVYLPVDYQQRFDLHAGDSLNVLTEDGPVGLTVQGFVRDAQMASSLSAATRFLVAEQDFRQLAAAGGGEPEIIVSYLMQTESGIAGLQRAYEAEAELPSNGPAVTVQMIRIINALSDGIVAIALMFASLLLIVIALLNLRFVIRGTLEEEVRQIGAMKALGLPSRQIAGLYLSKYSLMTLAACAVGGALAFPATAALTASIRVNYAAAPTGLSTFFVPAGALFAVYGIVMLICRSILGQIGRIQVVNALVHGSLLNEHQTARRARRLTRHAKSAGLADYRGRNVLNWLTLQDLRAERSHWTLIPVVFFLTAVLMILPLNLLSTFESPRFITYMGAPESDLRADLQYTDGLEAAHTELMTLLAGDGRLGNLRVFATHLFQARGGEGWETLRVETGDFSTTAVEYLAGASPAEGQLALSALNAAGLGVDVGDSLELRRNGQTDSVTISGIYQDVTNGGRTAKLQLDTAQHATGFIIYADLEDPAAAVAIAGEYSGAVPGLSVVPMREYVQQTLSYVTDAFRSTAVLALAFGIATAALLTTLFLRLRLAHDRPRHGVLASLGFSSRELAGQVLVKTLLATSAGTALGALFTATAGEFLVGQLLALTGTGLMQLQFLTQPLLAYGLVPILLIGAGMAGAFALTRQLHGADKSSWLRAA